MSHTSMCPECRFPHRTKEACYTGTCEHRTHCACELGTARDPSEDEIVAETSEGIRIKRHAVNRWMQRTASAGRPEPLAEAWERAVPVGGDHYKRATKVRLYHPENLLFVVAGEKLRTAKPIGHEWDDLHLDHFDECESCGYLLDPARGAVCPWCDYDPDGERSTADLSPVPAHERASQLAAERDEVHRCPECETETVGPDPLCKVCRAHAEREPDEPEEPETCAEASCWDDPASESQFCTMHQFLDDGSGGAADA